MAELITTLVLANRDLAGCSISALGREHRVLKQFRFCQAMFHTKNRSTTSAGACLLHKSCSIPNTITCLARGRRMLWLTSDHGNHKIRFVPESCKA